MDPFYGVVVLTCVSSMITVVFAVGKDTVLDEKNIQWFRFSFILVAIGMTCEYLGVLFSDLGNVPKLLFTLVTLCEYILSPMLSLSLAGSCGIKKPIKPMLLVMLTHAIIEIAASPFGLIFYITEEGVFSRGDYYWVYLFFCAVSFLFILFVFIYLGREANTKNLITLILITITFLFGQVASIVDDHIYTGYLSISMTAVLLYILTQDLRRCKLMKQMNIEQEKSTHDSLTGVSNRACYERKTAVMNDNIKGNPAGMQFAICECDLNNLKVINDTYGHESGDFYIKTCCKKICDVFKHSAVYRTGGDEFVIIMMNEDYENYEKLKMEINDFVMSEIKKKGSILGKISFAAGFSKYNYKTDKTVADVLNRADFEMYIHKKCVKSSAGV